MKHLSIYLLFVCFSFSACKKEATGVCEAHLQVACICPKIYDPVCGCDGETYANSCVAECYSITDYTSGPCSN